MTTGAVDCELTTDDAPEPLPELVEPEDVFELVEPDDEVEPVEPVEPTELLEPELVAPEPEVVAEAVVAAALCA